MTIQSITQRCLLCICVWTLILVDCSWSQSSDSAFSEGPLQDAASAMNELVRLKIVDQRLQLRRDWGDKTVNASEQDLIDVEFEKLKKRGFDDANAAQLAKRIIRTTKSRSPLSKVFFALAGGRSSSMHQGSGVGKKTMSFRSASLNANAELRSLNNDIDLHIVEIREPKREFKLRQMGDGAFGFVYSGNDFSIRLEQKTNGQIELTRTIEEKTKRFQADNFVALRKQHLNLVDDWLLPVMQHVGVAIPMLADNQEIVEAVLARLANSSMRRDEFERLVKRLDSESYDIRVLASEQIKANRSQWKDLIEEKLQSRPLTLEIRARLQAVMASGQNESQIDQIIRDQNLLNSPDYLIGLLNVADSNQTELIISRLQQITGSRFERPNQWNDWLKKKTDSAVKQPNPPDESSDK